MIDYNESLNKMLSTLNSACEATGIMRAILMTDIYGQINKLNSDLTDERNAWNQEKIKLETEINDLKEELKKRTESDAG